jgi:hypothetical protein
MPRFGQFIGAVTWAMGQGMLLRQVTMDGNAVAVTPLFLALGKYLSATLRRFTALHERFVAGTLATAPRKRPTVQSTAEGATVEQPKPARRAPGIAPGPVLLREFGVRFFSNLRALLEDPEMREFLAAAPQAGRILRPLWRKLSPEALPEILRLPPRPPRPRKPRAPKPPRPARPAAGNGPPRLRRVTLSDGTRSWEPIPCYPFGEKPPRRRRSRAADPWEVDPWAPAPAPPPPARPRPAREPPPRPNPERRLCDYNWIGRLFMR